MSSRKEAILTAALSLFNEHGIDGVTTRDIAKKLKISPGNLTYYFPTKDAIVLELTMELSSSLNKALSEQKGTPPKNTLIAFYRQLETGFTIQLKYAFLFNKRYGELFSHPPERRKLIQETFREHFTFWHQLNRQLVKEKLARPILIEETNAVCYLVNFLAVYWQQEFSIFFPDLTSKGKVQRALAIYFQAYKPYLTKKGLNELKPLLIKLKHY